MMQVEKRFNTTPLEYRANVESDSLTVSGYAVRYEEESELLEYGFREVIKPNAFSDSIKKRNILALYQHNDNNLLASTKANTLRLEERADGIYFELDLLETRKELYELVKRGDLSNMSFGFSCEEERFTRNGDIDIREVTKGTLYEVSLVHTPAYPTSSVVAERSLDKYNSFKKEIDTMETANNQNQEVNISAMAGGKQEVKNEVRAYNRGEKFSKEESNVSLGGLIRAYVTGKGNREEREMLTNSNTGNFLVPSQVSNSLIDLARSKSFLFGNATTVNMGSNQSVSIPKVITDPTAAFKKQGATIVSSDPTFGEIKLDAKYLYALIQVPLELVKTGVGIEEKLNYLIATAMNQTLEKAALSGAVDGFSGIFNDAGILKQTITAVNYDEVKKGVKAVATNNGEAKDLVLSTNNWYDIESAKATDQQFITPPPFYTAMSKFATNAIDDKKILVGDLSSIYVGMLQDISVEVSTHYEFSKGVLSIRASWYGDVQLGEPKKLCLMTVGTGA